MNLKFFGRLLFVASLLAPAASCTLSEPSGVSDDSNSGYVKQINMMGVNAVGIKYDNQNRVIRISAPLFDCRLDATYNGSKLVSIVFDDDESSVTMSDIKLNSMGFVESFTSVESDEPEPSNMKLEYDSEGHLTRIIEDGETSYVYTWSKGLLTNIDEIDPEDPHHTSHHVYTYTNIENKHQQWSPFWFGTLGYYNLTGLFGKAPSKFIASATDGDETERYDYRLNTHGYIRAERTQVEGETLTFNYTY